MQEMSNEYGTIITFYSYKGGTGRSMAVANVACLLGRRVTKNQRVLMVDWDLESPGLHRYFSESKRRGALLGPGLIEYFTAIKGLTERHPGLYSTSLDRRGRDLIEDSYPIEDFVVTGVAENVDLMKAGRIEESDYVHRVNQFRWSELYARCPAVFEAFQVLLSDRWAYVLIDSRTGLTDIGGISTSLLPEKLVIVFTPNRQSLEGAVSIVPQVLEYRRRSNDFRPLSVFPLPSRIELNEEVLRRKWRDEYQERIEELFRRAYKLEAVDLSRYFDDVQIPQKGYYSYGEVIAVLEERRNERLSLSRAYLAFTNRLVGWGSAWEESSYRSEPRDWRGPQRIRFYVTATVYLQLALGLVILPRFIGNIETSLANVLLCMSGGIAGGAVVEFLNILGAFRRQVLTKRRVRESLIYVAGAALLGLLVGGIRAALGALVLTWETWAVSLALGGFSRALLSRGINVWKLLVARGEGFLWRI